MACIEGKFTAKPQKSTYQPQFVGLVLGPDETPQLIPRPYGAPPAIRVNATKLLALKMAMDLKFSSTSTSCIVGDIRVFTVAIYIYIFFLIMHIYISAGVYGLYTP